MDFCFEVFIFIGGDEVGGLGVLKYIHLIGGDEVGGLGVLKYIHLICGDEVGGLGSFEVYSSDWWR